MKKLSLLLLSLISVIQIYAFEGTLEYLIHSGDRDWKMVCYVKGDHSKSEIYLGDTLFQSILNNTEGEFLIDEMNKQVFSLDYERKKFGTQKDAEKKRKAAKYQYVGEFSEDGLQGHIYSVKHKRKKYHLKVAEGIGYVPGVFMEQFSSMWGIAHDGEPVFKKHMGAPVSIYREKKKKAPLMQLVGKKNATVDDKKFEIGIEYIRAKMRFKMR